MGFPSRDDTINKRTGAMGRCQMLPSTAIMVIKYAVRKDRIPEVMMMFASEPYIRTMLRIGPFAELLTYEYLRYIQDRGVRRVFSLAYHYHSGHNRTLIKGGQSWAFAEEVTKLYGEMPRPPTPRRKK